jgi:multidrug resistance efflux pump
MPAMNLRPWIILPFMGAALLRAQDDLPHHAPGDALDFEPKLMLDGPHAAPVASPTPSPEDRVQQCEAALLVAEQRAADSEQLFKEDILAKVEMEARILRIVQVRKELADARLDVATAQAEAAKKSFDARAASQSDLDTANAALKTAQTTAAAASAEWDKAQLDAAILDLQRKRKLYSEGVGTRRELQMAEDRVALLSGTTPR